MIQRVFLPALATLAVCLALPPRTVAVPLTYEIGTDSTVNANLNDPGLVIQTYLLATLPDVAFTLNDGQNYTFDAFKIWTDETDVALWEDTAKKTISVNLDFDVPDENAFLVGDTYGIWGVFQSGQITWNGPITLTSADRTFQVWLSDEEFNEGLFGLNEGKKYGAVVQATVKQIGSAYTSVPDNGSTAMLLGLSLLVIAVVSKKSRPLAVFRGCHIRGEPSGKWQDHRRASPLGLRRPLSGAGVLRVS